jgi:hypothetical protein
VKFWVEVVVLTPPPPPTNIFFLVLNFLNLTIVLGKKMEKKCGNSIKM